MYYNNLRAEFVRLNMSPHIGVANALDCSERVARNRLNRETRFTVDEAIKIREKYFPEMTIDYLFSWR